MNIIEFYKKETFVPKIILATLTALIIISFIEFLYEINTYSCYKSTSLLIGGGPDKFVAFNRAEFYDLKTCISLTKPLFLKAGLLSVLFPILLMSFWLLLRNIFKKNENKLKSFFQFFEINRIDRGLFRIGLVLSWLWVVFACIFMMAEIPDLSRGSWDTADSLERFFTGFLMLWPIIFFPLIWLLLKKVGIWIYRGFK